MYMSCSRKGRGKELCSPNEYWFAEVVSNDLGGGYILERSKFPTGVIGVICIQTVVEELSLDHGG